MESLVEYVWLELQSCLHQVQRISTYSEKLFGLDFWLGLGFFFFFLILVSFCK